LIPLFYPDLTSYLYLYKNGKFFPDHKYGTSVKNDDPVLWIRIGSYADLDPAIQDKGFNDKNKKNVQPTKNCDSDVQATEDFSPQKRTSSTSKHEVSLLLNFRGSFLPSWIRIRIPDADPDLADQDQCVPCVSGSTTLDSL
jgi:hypothetical protein